MRRYSAAAVFALSVLVAASRCALSDEFAVGDVMLSIPPPKGYCFFDRRDPAEAEFIELMQAGRPSQHVLAVVEACSLVQASPSERFELAQHFGVIAIMLFEGKLIPIPSVSRKAHIAKIVKNMPPIDWNEAHRLSADDPMEQPSGREAGILDADDNAVYFGEISRVSPSPGRGSYLRAGTVLRGFAISVELFDVVGPSGFERRLSFLKRYMAILVQENPDS